MKPNLDWWNSDPEKPKPINRRPAWVQAAIEADAEEIEAEGHRKDRPGALINPHTGEVWFPDHPQYADLAEALADEKRDFERAAPLLSLVAEAKNAREHPKFTGRTPEGLPKLKLVLGRGSAQEPMDRAVVANAVEFIGVGESLEVLPSDDDINVVRIITMLVLRVFAAEDTKFWPLKTTTTQLSEKLGLKYHFTKRQIRKLLDRLARAFFSVTVGSRTLRMSALDFSYIDEASGKVHLKLHHKLGPFFLDLGERDEGYKSIWHHVLKLRRRGAVRLYWYMRRFVRKGPRQQSVTRSELYRVLQVDERTSWAKLHEKHLRPAVDEINQKTELRLSCKPKREGGADRKRGKVQAVLFQLTERRSMTSKRQQGAA
jgi:hypothetical protein